MAQPEWMIQYRDKITNKADILQVNLREYYEIYSYIGGDGPFFYFVDKEMMEMQPGDILILRPGELRGSCKKVKARYRRLYTRFGEDTLALIGQLCPEVERQIAHGDALRVTLPPEAAAEYASLIEKVRIAQERQDTFSSGETFAFLLQQLVLLCRYAEKAVPPPCETVVPRDFVREVVAYIGDHWATISSIEEIAEALHYSRNYLASAFRRHMNIGIREYLLEKKLHEAMAMLLNGKSVTACAYDCGFGGASYFIRVFKNRYGMTPKAYTKQIKR